MLIRVLYLLLMVVSLNACNAPPRDFWGVPFQEVTFGGDTFQVRMKGSEAVAVRTNTAYRPRLSAVAPQAKQAIEAVTGCRVFGPVTGDQIIIYALLECT